MARRRAFYPIDTSDRLSNVVVSSIAILIVALLALILWMTGTTEPETTAVSGQTSDAADGAAGADPGRVPVGEVATADDATVSTPERTDGAAAAGAAGDQAPDGGDATEGEPSVVVVPPAGDGDPAAGGGDGDTGRDPDASLAPGGANGGTGTPPAAEPLPDRPSEPAGDVLPDPGRGSGLFSRDDPERTLATTVSTAPRDTRIVTADFDGDGVDERVWSAIVGDHVVTRLERRVDGRWRPGRDHSGAPADRLVALRAKDLTGDGLPEVFTKQWVATEGESVTLWDVVGGDRGLDRMLMSGGCWANSNTVGLIGANVNTPAEGPATVVALCKDKPRPTQQWSSALYRWQEGRWVFDRLLGKYE